MFDTTARMTRPVAVVAAVLLATGAAFAGAALGTPSSGTSSVPLGEGVIGERINVNTDGIRLKIHDEARVVTQAVSFEPGGTSGWHVHPGPVVVTVTRGSFTVYDARCRPRVYGRGDAFVEEPGAPVLVTNPGGSTSEALATFIVPPGVPLRADAPAPEGCAGTQ